MQTVSAEHEVKRVRAFLQRHWKVATIAIVSVALVIWLGNWMVSSPYTVVNAGDGNVYKVNRRTGESWLLTGTREIPVRGPSRKASPPTPESEEETRQQTALLKAQNSHVLGPALRNPSNPTMQFMSNSGVVQQLLESDHQVDIRGWKSQKIDDDTYLVSCTFTEPSGQERGYYFEVKLNTDTVRNIFGRTVLHQRYAKYGVSPAYAIGTDNRTPVYSWWEKDPLADPSKPTGETMTEEEFWKRGTDADKTNKTNKWWEQFRLAEPQAENTKQSTAVPLPDSPKKTE